MKLRLRRGTYAQSLNGFTLIELMIVVAILGILATITVPVFKDRIIKAQITEAIEISALAKEAIVAFRKKTGEIPGDNYTAGIPEPRKIIGNYVAGLEIKGGAINITLGNRVHKNIDGKILTIRPAYVADEKVVPIAWVCGDASVPDGMQVQGRNLTNLLHEELPIDCRI